MTGLRVITVFAMLLAASEVAHAIAGRMHNADPSGHPCTVLVLGYPANDDGSASFIEQQRMSAAVDASARLDCKTMLISGGAAHNAVVEADVMASLVPAAPAPRFAVIRERQAKDTRQNISFSLPLVPAGDDIIIVSHALHAQRARGYVCAAAPRRCNRTFVFPTEQAAWRVPQRLIETLHELQVIASGG